MSDLVNEYNMWEYDELSMLDKAGNVVLVKNRINGRLAVKKIISFEQGKIYDVLQDESGKYIPKIHMLSYQENNCIVLEDFFNGETLESYLKNNGILNPEEVKKIIVQICDGVEFLHSKDIVHRDLTLSNILIDQNETVKLIDFDISRTKKSEKMQDTQILGTQGFAAPEQFGFRQTDNRSDIYALGVIMNYMLTGEFPNAKLYHGKYSNVIAKCIQIAPELRYKNVGNLKSSLLGEVSEDAPVMKKILSKIPGFRTRKWWKRTIAIVVYLVFTILFYAGISSIPDTMEYTITIITVFVLPGVILTNFLGIADKLPFMKYKYGWKRQIIKFIWTCIFSLMGMLIFSLMATYIMPPA